MVTSTVGTLPAGSPAEFGTPHHQRLVEQTSLLEIFQEARDGLIDLLAIAGMICLKIAVSVPGSCSATAVVDLNEPHAAFDQTSSCQAQLAE